MQGDGSDEDETDTVYLYRGIYKHHIIESLDADRSICGDETVVKGTNGEVNKKEVFEIDRLEDTFLGELCQFCENKYLGRHRYYGTEHVSNPQDKE